MLTLDPFVFWIHPENLAVSLAGRVASVSLGIIAAIIAIVLFLASRTKWGQDKPLTKCIALAVLAHVWLLMYAYGTRVRQVGPGSGGGATSSPTSMTIDLTEFSIEGPSEQDFTPPDPLLTAPSLLETLEDPVALLSNDSDLPAEPVVPTVDVEDKVVAAENENTLVETQKDKPLGEIDAQAMTGDETVIQSGVEPERSLASRETIEPTTSPPRDETPTLAATPAPNLAKQSKPLIRQRDQQPVPDPYQLRFSESRGQTAAQFGGDTNTEAAVDRALAWLAANQESDGSWNAARHGAGRETRTMERDRQGTGSKSDTGVTGLALLAFLGAGNTHDQGYYADNVSRGLAFLITYQASDGDLAGPKQVGHSTDVFYARMYCHGMATLALAEAYAMTGDQRLIDPVRRAAAYTLRAQNPQSGGWRYQIQFTGDAGDLSQFGWQAIALSSARHAGTPWTPSLLAKLRAFLDSVSVGRYGGLAIYRPVPGQTPSTAMTAEALACRRLLQMPLSAEGDQEATAYLLKSLPGQSEENVYFWYYATLALFQNQDQAWRVWNEALKSHLVATQVNSGPLLGSWEPRCIWAGYGGRIYSTAMSALCLEVYYRYLPMYQQTPSATPSWQASQTMAPTSQR